MYSSMAKYMCCCMFVISGLLYRGRVFLSQCYFEVNEEEDTREEQMVDLPDVVARSVDGSPKSTGAVLIANALGVTNNVSDTGLLSPTTMPKI